MSTSEEREERDEAGPSGRLRDYAETTKSRVVGLTMVTAAVAALLAGGPPLLQFLMMMLATALTVGGAAALNNVLECERDALMARTRNRALPAGRLRRRQVLNFGVALCTAGVVVLAAFVNLTSAALAALGVLYYVVIYTVLLKPRSPRSVVPGGLAGIFPPLIGWASSGQAWSLDIVYVCAVVFFWSPPHFWSLALAKSDEYAGAGIPTLPVSLGATATRREIATYTLALIGLSLLPVVQGARGTTYLVWALVAGAIMGGLALALTRSGSAETAWRFYRLSGPYLALLLLAMLLDAGVGGALTWNHAGTTGGGLLP